MNRSSSPVRSPAVNEAMRFLGKHENGTERDADKRPVASPGSPVSEVSVRAAQEWLLGQSDHQAATEAEALEMFNAIDKNSDGQLTHREIKNFMQKEPWARQLLAGETFHWQEFFKNLDIDGDGNIQQGEFLKFYHASIKVHVQGQHASLAQHASLTEATQAAAREGTLPVKSYLPLWVTALSGYQRLQGIAKQMGPQKELYPAKLEAVAESLSLRCQPLASRMGISSGTFLVLLAAATLCASPVLVILAVLTSPITITLLCLFLGMRWVLDTMLSMLFFGTQLVLSAPFWLPIAAVAILSFVQILLLSPVILPFVIFKAAKDLSPSLRAV